jgi:hypothetical protein
MLMIFFRIEVSFSYHEQCPLPFQPNTDIIHLPGRSGCRIHLHHQHRSPYLLTRPHFSRSGWLRSAVRITDPGHLRFRPRRHEEEISSRIHKMRKFFIVANEAIEVLRQQFFNAFSACSHSFVPLPSTRKFNLPPWSFWTCKCFPPKNRLPFLRYQSADEWTVAFHSNPKRFAERFFVFSFSPGNILWSIGSVNPRIRFRIPDIRINAVEYAKRFLSLAIEKRFQSLGIVP